MSHFTILHAGASSWPPEDEGSKALTERGHSHPVYHLLLYTGGQNVMIHDKQRMDCSRGTLVLTDPGMVHEYRPQEPGGASFIEITFDLRNEKIPLSRPWNEIFSTWFGPPEVQLPSCFVVVPPHIERLESTMEQVIGTLTGPGPRKEVVATLVVVRLFYELLDMVSVTDSDTNLSTQDRMERTRLMLERNFAGSITVAKLAETACLSPGAFIRAFSTRYGVSPMVYRKQLRLNAAKHLLAVSGRSVGEIALNVGYRDIFAFSRTFRSETGMTASEWRKLRTGETEDENRPS